MGHPDTDPLGAERLSDYLLQESRRIGRPAGSTTNSGRYPVAIHSVNVPDGQGRATAAPCPMRIGFPVLVDKDSAVLNRWGARLLPTTFMLDAAGMPLS